MINQWLKIKKIFIKILNIKKSKISQYSEKYIELTENFISDYIYYTKVLKGYEQKAKNINNGNDKQLILNSSKDIQVYMFDKLEEICNIYDIYLQTFFKETDIVKNYYNKFNYKY